MAFWQYLSDVKFHSKTIIYFDQNDLFPYFFQAIPFSTTNEMSFEGTSSSLDTSSFIVFDDTPAETSDYFSSYFDTSDIDTKEKAEVSPTQKTEEKSPAFKAPIREVLDIFQELKYSFGRGRQ